MMNSQPHSERRLAGSKTRFQKRFVASVAICVLLGWGSGSPGFAQSGMRGGAGGPGKSAAMEAFRTAQQEKMRAFLENEAAEGKTFMESLNGKSKAEKLAGIKEFKTAQYEKNTAFRDEMHKERLAMLETQGANMGQGRTGAGAEGMRAKRLARLTADYEEMKTFFAGKHAENLAFLEKMAADPAMDGQALNQAIQAFFQSQKAAAQEYMQKKKAGQSGR